MNPINIIIGVGMITSGILIFLRLLLGSWKEAITAFLIVFILLFGVTGGISLVLRGIGIISESVPYFP